MAQNPTSATRTIKWLAVAVALAGLGFAVHPLYVEGVIFGLWQPLQRPPGVSSKAHYVSSIEDGTWFDCSVDLVKNVDTCKAWDSYGAPLADGDFRLECLGRAATAKELRPSSVSSSGGHAYAIYLFGEHGARDLTLVPVSNEHPKPCPEVTITYPKTSAASGSK